MKLTSTAVFLCSSLILSCTLAPAASIVPHGPLQQEDRFVPIRFGDARELGYEAEFFPGATYDPEVATPDSFLGQKHGSRLAHHEEVLAAFRTWAEASDRVSLKTFGQTHEGRELVYAVVTSAANHSRIDEIRANHARLADPRGLGTAEGQELIEAAPGVAWMGYSIHGDELSGTDASLAVAYHLIAGTDPDVLAMLDELVILIDPCLNPDGRERIIGMVEQSAGYTPNLDYASMHRGRWPFGRGNHYLFDMNRDWMGGSQPETRARWSAVLDWNPQLFVDAHEMGSLDTFLFYPQAAPFNPELPERTGHWQGVFAAGASSAFDANGWSYYTREWADAWGPFYSDSWGSLTGAVGILYEQAGTAGFQLRRASGELLTYREAVHHQVAASFENLRTLQEYRVEILSDYLAAKRLSVDEDTEGNELVLAVIPEGNQSRLAALRRILDGQRMEYSELSEPASMEDATGARGGKEDSIELPEGTLILPARQPQRRLVRAFFNFDPRIDTDTLREEREELERKNSSKMYDLTAWSLPHALNLNAWWGELDEPQLRAPTTGFEFGLVEAIGPDQTAFGWVVDGVDDGSVAFAARAMEAGLTVHLSDRDFETGKEDWSRGSLLIRRGEHALSVEELEARIDEAARAAGTRAYPIRSGRAPGDGPDLGGGHFHLLSRPRVALLANSPVSSSTYGHLWHHLDVILGVPFSIIDAQSIRGADLRRYNVIVLPPGNLRGVLEPVKKELGDWVRGGGTLIACGNSAALMTKGRLDLSSVSLRRNALEELDLHERAVLRERGSMEIEIDEALVWEGAAENEEDPEESDEDKANEEGGVPIEERDAWMRRFSPSGANLLAEVDTGHWLTCGAGKRMPIGMSGRDVLLSRAPVQTPVRFTSADDLRLGGLLWPEARERIADSAWLTREGSGNGQLVLFAGTPAFRGYHHATGRLFSNAVIYGPGMGTNQPVGW